MSTYQERQAYRDSHPGVVVDNDSSSDGGFHSNTPDGTPTPGGTTNGGGGGGGGGGGSAGAGGSSNWDGTYHTVNGPQTIASMVRQLQAAGWGGNPSDSAAVQRAYAATTGGAVTPSWMFSTGTTGPGSGPGSPGSGLDPDTQALLAGFGASSGFSLKQLAENARQFDAQLAFAREQMEKIGIPQLQIQKQLADWQVQFQQQQMDLARLTQQQQNAQQQAQLGFNYLSQAAQFAATDPFQLSDFLRGASYAGVPQFIRNLQAGLNQSGVGTPQAAPVPALRMGDLLGQMGSPPPASVYSDNPPPPAGAAPPAAPPPGRGVPPEVVGGAVPMPSLPGGDTGTPRPGGGGSPTFDETGRGGVGPPQQGVGDYGAGTPFAPGLPSVQATQAQGTISPAAPSILTSGAGGGVGPATPMSQFTPTILTQGGVPAYHQTQAASDAIAKLYAAGPQALRVGSLESLSPVELQTFTQGINNRYGSLAGPAFLQAYQQSRPMQTATRTAYY